MKTTILILALICLGGVAARTAGNACPAGQYQLEGRICLSCSGTTFNGCLACAAPDGKCTECAAGWNLSDKGSCTRFHESCAEQLCDIAGTQACGDCADGYRPAVKDDVETAYCVACSQGNCVSCTVDECTECRAGFFLENKACTACSTGCVECTSATACSTCGSGYFLNAGACTACGTGCSVCTAADQCTTCSVDNILNTTTGACTSKVGCEEGDGTDKCKVCRDGYRLLADGNCKACEASAQTCDGSGADQTILTCNVNLILATATATAKQACQTRTDGVCLNQDAAGVCSKCGSGYVVSKGKCVWCSTILTGCETCQAGEASTTGAAATCSACNSRSYAVGSPITACTPCASNCLSCTSAGCSECAEGYYKASATATTCTDCNAGGAKSCTVATNASACKERYGAQEHGICWKCDPTYNCLTCDEYLKCKTCNLGSDVQTSVAAAVSATTNQCVVCDSNCRPDDTTKQVKCPEGPNTCYFTSTLTGTECKDGFKINTKTHRCVATCEATNCSACETHDYGKCKDTASCSVNHFKNADGVCTTCLNTNCETCADATTCATCRNGFSIKAATAGQYCQVACTTTANVKQCTTDGATTPSFSDYVCNNGFGTGGATTCAACTVANCAKCAVAATCDECIAGKHPVANCASDCRAKARTCTSDTVDTSCTAGNCLGAADTCYTCPLNCKVGSAETATAGIDGNGNCPVDQCKEGWTSPFTTGTTTKVAGTCVQCTVSNCATCTADKATTECTGCKVGYNLTSTKTCMATVDVKTDGCVRNPGTYEKCTSCSDGYYHVTASSTCVACPANCKCVTATPDICDSCLSADHFYDGTSTPKTCKTCTVANCKTCTADAAKCTACQSGFFRESETKCTACTADCETCDKADNCTACKNGYFSFTLPTGVTGTVKYCAACAANCKFCDVKTDGSQTCTECISGFYLNGKTCSSADCHGTDGKVCNRCIYGKILKDGKCADCTGDNSCPVSCSPVTPGPGGPGGNTSNTTSATDSSSKIVFSFFILAFFAILGHMLI